MIHLTREMTMSGLGIVTEYDSRDNIFSPEDGYQYKLEWLLNRDFFGSDLDFDKYSFKGLNYWRLNKKFRAGLRIESEVADTDEFITPMATPFVDLRGIQSMRYQGKYVAMTETELTWDLDHRWSIKGFAGVGRAGNDMEGIRESANRETYGGGFRYVVARRYGFRMGIDVARGPEDTVWYIQAGTAW
ncbi:hypothetical protein [Teredinibacter sp. KSP-S5-2]|uniref:hypothetical protein n=1 Tax=Teredinibacter sp. KSP-S5-2 TaxID=3034506 RepID=UPI00293471BA|nr:hypothetical protein [Teredinibacter sp. KSP-S5-2]WNO10629.1 BamA/TamA family outer membrane protein [Teredinibacter sp. KSP-S5-2]